MKLSGLTQLIIILTVAAPLSGCTLFEHFGLMNRAKEKLLIPAKTPTSVIFLCVEHAVMELHNSKSQSRGAWETKVTRKDEDAGIIETGNFSESHRLGFRVKAVHLRDDNIVKLELRGTGVYYSDLGVDEGIEILKAKIKLCIET